MEGKDKFKLIFRETLNILENFFKPYKLIDPILEIPSDLYKSGFRNGIISSLTTVVTLVFTFTLKASNYFVEQKLIILGIIFFLLYLSRDITRTTFSSINKLNDTKLREIFDNSLMVVGAKMLGILTNKVEQYDDKQNCYKLMSNRKVVECLKRYLRNLWGIKITYLFNLFTLANTIIMLVFTIVTNSKISQYFLIPVVVFFVILSFARQAYDISYSSKNRQKMRETDDKSAELMDDLIKVPFVVKQDLSMRLKRLNSYLRENSSAVVQYHSTMNYSHIILCGIETFTNFLLVGALLYGVGLESITLATIPELLATLLIVETALSHVRHMAFTMSDYYRTVTHMKEEEATVQLILDTYHREVKQESKTNPIQDLKLKPFSISYTEQSENDRPFTLVSDENIEIGQGEVVILSGPSGSGKSTFMKMITERIRLEKSEELPSTSRFMFYDEELRFGSLSIYDELFCDEQNPNLLKMRNILENMNLWKEINYNCKDIWQWMKEKSYSKALSNGQKQRLILAKMLYWLDESIDVIVLDECTSGLDVKTPEDFADAERILEYIVRFCNRNRKRIVLISTHQDIDGFIKKLSPEFKFRNLEFCKIDNRNIVHEI